MLKPGSKKTFSRNFRWESRRVIEERKQHLDCYWCPADYRDWLHWVHWTCDLLRNCLNAGNILIPMCRNFVFMLEEQRCFCKPFLVFYHTELWNTGVCQIFQRIVETTLTIRKMLGTKHVIWKIKNDMDSNSILLWTEKNLLCASRLRRIWLCSHEQ